MVPTKSLVIVTVVKNDLFGLKRTELSVRSQSKSVNWVIVTPKDNSETWSYVQKLHRMNLVTEILQDVGGGVYVAMNIAIAHLPASDWVWFLNAGDEFATSHSYTEIHSVIEETKFDWIYGGHFLGSESGEILGEVPAPAKFDASNQLFARRYVSHQSVIFKNSLLRELDGFETRLKIAADWDLFVRANRVGNPDRVPQPISVFYMGGLSTAARQLGNSELWALRSEHLSVKYFPKSLIWFGYRNMRNKFVQSIELRNPKLANLIRKIRLGLKNLIKELL